MAMEEESSGRASIGLLLPETLFDVATGLRTAKSDGFEFVVSSTTGATGPQSAPSRSDVLGMRALWWRTNVVGLIDDAATLDGLDFCSHMQLPAAILPDLASLSADIHNYAAKVSTMTEPSSCVKLWVPVPLTPEGLQQWQLFHRLTGYSRNVMAMVVLQPTLSINSSLDFNPNDYLAQQQQLLHIFVGESVAAMSVSTELFLTNKKGYPTLSSIHQMIVTQLLKRIGRTVKILLKGPGKHAFPANPSAQGATGCLPYLDYLQYLRKQPRVMQACDTDEARMEANYLDSLQRPLQPLADHLEYETYETFERDPIKYSRYKDAIQMALNDIIALEQQRDQVTVFVVGAGRGPLVSAVFQAFEALQQSLRLNIVVVEKNPSAVIILKSRANSDPQWLQYHNSMTIVHSDLRSLQLEMCGGNVADIVVSELLGSFGDNELSPECLDAFFAAPVCRPGTISIPQKYTSYLSVANSGKLHAQAHQQSLYPNDNETGAVGLLKAMETPYVVRAHACSQMCKEQECWAFEHPPKENTPIHNRQIVLNFDQSMEPSAGCQYGCGYGLVDDQPYFQAQSDKTGQAWTCTGLLGTFSADLYTSRQGHGTSNISICPFNFSVGMFSWFPLYFPISEPLLVPAAASLRVYLWRRKSVEHAKVWYEWSIAVHRNGELLSATPIHNTGGRSSFVSMR